MEKYKKLRLIGRGAHGTVFLCNQKDDGKLVIAKEIPVDELSIEERHVSMNEAQVLSMLDHPNVIAYYDSFIDDKTMIIIMEYVQGGTLFDFLNCRNGNLMTEQEVLHYFGQMVYTMQHVHGKQILHRDLKSQNILLNERKTTLKIGDFGISKVLSSKSKAYTVVGTPSYISPELCEGKPYNQKSDIWALGCLLYELMTLKRPFDATTLPALIMKIMKGSFEPASSIYSYDLRKLLLSMLHLDPLQRPTAAQIMCQPIMIKAIFKLYVDIGSIPGSKRSDHLLPVPSTTRHRLSSADSDSSVASNTSIRKEKKLSSLWFFQDASLESVRLPLPANTYIRSASLGADQKVAVTANGLLLSWTIRPAIAVNFENELMEHEEASWIPYFVDDITAINISSVVCGDQFTVCLSDTGVVFTYGKASSGCLGSITDKDLQQPRIVEALFSNNIKSIACGPRHVLALSEEDEIFAWGYGKYGCLGLGSEEFQALPQLVEVHSKEKPRNIYCGEDCSFIMLNDFRLFVCGSNRHNKIATDTDEGSQFDAVLFFTDIKLEALYNEKIVHISSAKSHTVLLTESGHLYSMGSNKFGQLGHGDLGDDYNLLKKVQINEDTLISQVACGDSFTVALTQDQTILCWGKCPTSLVQHEEESPYDSLHKPKCLEGKKIVSASCYSKNCIIVTENE